MCLLYQSARTSQYFLTLSTEWLSNYFVIVWQCKPRVAHKENCESLVLLLAWHLYLSLGLLWGKLHLGYPDLTEVVVTKPLWLTEEERLGSLSSWYCLSPLCQLTLLQRFLWLVCEPAMPAVTCKKNIYFNTVECDQLSCVIHVLTFGITKNTNQTCTYQDTLDGIYAPTAFFLLPNFQFCFYSMTLWDCLMCLK